jgi:acetylornithine deacetylase/succinyl-diaminopimelate desuccinylase-like protein
MNHASTAGRSGAVVSLCQQLIQFDTSNPGSNEREAASFAADILTSAGLRVTVLESEPGRPNLVARVRGRRPDRPALLVHGHLDVVPARAEDWSVGPFSGAIRDGYLWGRGAIDMKHMVAMILDSATRYGLGHAQPDRDIVFTLFADEEAGGTHGARHLVKTHAEVFDGCDQAIGEVGGFSIATIGQERLYAVANAEKGLAWIQLEARATGGHASMAHPDNPIRRVADAITRLCSDPMPLHLTSGLARFLQRVAAAAGTSLDLHNPGSIEHVIDTLGTASRIIAPTLRHTLNPTQISGGWKQNVVPTVATALIDARYLPGGREQLTDEINRRLEGSEVEWSYTLELPAVEAPADADLVGSMHRSLVAEDPSALAVPYTLAAGSDAKWLSELGIHCYGFTPLQVPDDYDFAANFHGPDERVPIAGLEFGTRVLQRFLDSC